MSKAAKDKVLFPPGSDMEDVEMLETVEQALGVKLDAEDLTQCRNVGDLHAILLRKLPTTERGTTACLSALAFYRLRRVIASHYPGIAIKPTTPLSEIAGRFGILVLFRRLGRETGLDMPNVFYGWIALACGALVVPAGIEGFSQLGLSGIVAGPLMMIALGFVAARFLSSLPRAIVTVGDLSRSVGGLNAVRLLPNSDPLRRSEVWISLEAIIRQHTNWQGALTPGTPFYR